MNITFYPVRDNAAKIKLICNKTLECFHKERRLLIIVPNMEAARYVDLLLWKYPEEGFLPHIVTDSPTAEWIAITQAARNVNNASHLFNLCPTPIPPYPQVLELFELHDESHPQKLELSNQRRDFYKSRGFSVNS